MRNLQLDSKTLLNWLPCLRSILSFQICIAFTAIQLSAHSADQLSNLSGNVISLEQKTTLHSKLLFIPIYILDSKYEWVSSAMTNVYGRYSFNDLSSGNTYYINAVPNKTSSLTSSLKIVLAQEKEVNQDILINRNKYGDFYNTELTDPNLNTSNSLLDEQSILYTSVLESGPISRDLTTTGCVCLNNASLPGNGQFSTNLRLTSGKNETWFIRYVSGFYSNTSFPPPASPIPFTTGPSGTILSLISVSDSTAVYGLSGIFVSGIGFDIILENNYGDKVSLGRFRCHYDKPIVLESSNNVCASSSVRYTVKSRPGSTYNWNLSAGGIILSDPTKNSVIVSWNGSVGSTYYLEVIETNGNYCLEPLVIPVTIGNTSGNVFCIGNAQISLNYNCEATVTAKQLLVGGPYDFNSYSVMIFNKDGSLVPNNTVNYSHVNSIPLVAKVINTCNGNSCWSKITVEDKIPPTIVCQNDTIDCTRIRSHLGPFTYDNCDSKVQKILLSETIESTPCNALYSKIVHRRYQAKDASGNLSSVCNADYFLKRIVFDSIDFPDSLTQIDHSHLLCGKVKYDSLGRPDPVLTGVPTYFGHSLYPNKDIKYCDYSITFDDFISPGSNCVKKVNRVWKIVIWYCNTSRIITYNQLIEIVDNEAPVIHCPYDKEFFTSSTLCEANVYIPPIQVIDSCNNGVHLILNYPGGFIKNFTGGFIKLPTGNHVIRVEAFDDCYNVSECYFNVNVIDKAAPIAQCDRETTVSLDRFGEAWVPASVFDDGSYDNCHLKSMKVRRMDNGSNCNIKDSVLRDSVGFCCQDIGQLVTVLFVVTDEEGNSNTCMVQVEVQDKTVPHISCPHDITIECDYHFNPNDLSEFGVATASDNCKVIVNEKDSFDINQCREGFIYRIFTAGNTFGVDTCIQTISVINSDPFEESDIVWPSDLDTSICNLSILAANNLNEKYRPRIKEDKCDLVGVSYEDHEFRFVSGSDACFKILRKWKIINWCRFKDYRTGIPIIYEHQQVIKSHNKSAPNILSGCEEQKVLTQDSSCFTARIGLIATASDDCTDDLDLVNSYEIDLDRDSRIDYIVHGTGSTIDATGTYRLGKHRIKYIFEDRCGNKSVCEKDFELINAKKPSAYCKKGIAVGLEGMDLNQDGRIDGEFATVWAKDVDQGSNHPCGNSLTLSFGRDSSVHSITYDCDSIGRRTVLLCVTASNGQQDCCETFIDVQDNNNVNYCGCLHRPTDLTISSCNRNTDPNVINSFPVFGLCICDNKQVTHQDIIVRNIPNICYRIQRNWTVQFLCPNSNDVINFTQNIDVTTNLTNADIQWPSDSITVDNCDGSIDTARIGGVPRVCSYGGDIALTYSDRELPSRPSTRLFVRRWNVFSRCVQSQSFFFDQKILVLDPVGTKITFPADITVNSCTKPFLPDSLNGFPKTACGCDSITNTYRDDTLRNNPEFCYQLVRTWNVRVRCRPVIDTLFVGTQRIFRDVNLNPADIIWPIDTFRSFSCTINNNPDRTGRPSLRSNYCGLVSFNFVDSIVSNALCSTVRRTWSARNSCSATQLFTHTQILISLNQGVMSLNCPPNITVNADSNACGAIVSLNTPTLNNACNLGVNISNNAPQIYPVGLTNVIWTARDSCNHIARCTMSVTVIENRPPSITCARDLTIDCSENTQNLAAFGNPIGTDNCPGLTIRDSVIRNTNICGLGTIDRFSIATDASGNRASCLQVITIELNDPLDSLEVNWPKSPINVGECAFFDPGITGTPNVSQGAASCFRIRVSFTDTAFCVPGNCEVNRRWEVFDTCSNNILRFTQVIHRDDTIPPTIVGFKDSITIFATDTSCSGFVQIKASVTNCDSNDITLTNDSQFGGNGQDDASGFYPSGRTEVTFTAEDGCCNRSSKSIVITVIDTSAPEVTCKKVVKVIGDNGCAIFNANEFVVAKEDNCSPPAKIMVSFDENNFNDTIRTICCDSINPRDSQFTKLVRVYFKDESGNISLCESLLQAIDQFRICRGGNLNTVSVYGIISSRANKNMPDVPVELVSNNTLSTRSNYGGYYAFGNMAKGSSSQLKPSLNIDPLEGVSTYDIVLIQQHILGRKIFNDPTKFIAADVNNSRTVTSADISELRKLILGNINQFSKNDSWRFILSTYQFANPNEPLSENWTEVYSINDLQSNLEVNFKSIKIGDIDDSQKYSSVRDGIISRSNNVINLRIKNESLNVNEETTIVFKIENAEHLLGAQAFIQLDSRFLSLLNIDWNNSLNLTSEHISQSSLQQGVIKFSWLNLRSYKDLAIAVRVRAKDKIILANHIAIKDDHFKSEAYSVSGDILPLELVSEPVSESSDSDQSVVLYQNIPNPFNQATKIPFALSTATELTLEIFDIHSKLMYSKKNFYQKGYHEFEILKSDLPKSGLYYYQIHTSTVHLNKKMLMID